MNLERWLEICTKDIATSGALRIHTEIREHYHEALATHLAQGSAQHEAETKALHSLGDPHAINTQCKHVHLTMREHLALEGASKRGWWGSSMLFFPMMIWVLSTALAISEALGLYPNNYRMQLIWGGIQNASHEPFPFLVPLVGIFGGLLFAMVPRIKTSLVQRFGPSLTLAIEGVFVGFWLLWVHEISFNTSATLAESPEMIAGLFVLVFFALRWFWIHVPLLVKLHRHNTPQPEDTHHF